MKLYRIKKSNIDKKGRGLYASKNIKEGERIIDYVEDSCNTFANIVENFIPGEVYNVGGRVEWEKDIKEYSDIVLNVTGRDDSLVEYKEEEAFTTKIKTVDFSKAIKDLNHYPVIDP